MKLATVYDADGVVVAAVQVDADYAGPLPVPGGGHEFGEFDVPDSARDMRLGDLCTTLRVHTTERRLIDPRSES